MFTICSLREIPLPHAEQLFDTGSGVFGGPALSTGFCSSVVIFDIKSFTKESNAPPLSLVGL
jgi:hypothetical protein